MSRRPREPKLICKWRTFGKGVHRYDFDGRYAYISPTAEGYIGNIMMILDLKIQPAAEVGRWWIPGQWQAGGETYPWSRGRRRRAATTRCALGDRLYVSYWHHGYHILDISDMSKPKRIASGNYLAGLPASDAHLPADSTDPEGAQGDGGRGRGRGEALAPRRRLRLDLRHHQRVLPGADLDLPGGGLDPDGAPQPPMMGCHQPPSGSRAPSSRSRGSLKGLRLLDIADPFAAARGRPFYESDPPQGFNLASSNDVTIDDRGLCYLIDRQRGVDIIETKFCEDLRPE